MNDRIVREAERAKITGVCRSAWWAGENAGCLPKRRRLGPASVGWRLSDLQGWMNSLEAGPAAAPQKALQARRSAKEAPHA